MHFHSSLALVCSLALVASAYECGGNNNTVTIDAPSDLSQPVYFPPGFTEGQAIPQIDPEQGCSITVNIPQGLYATVTFYKHYGYNAGAYVLYSNRKLSLLADDDQTPYIFVSPYFFLNLLSQFGNQTTEFAFKIQYSKFPQIEKNVIDIYKGNAPVVVNGNNKLTTFVGSPNAMISLAAFSLADPSTNYLLRQSAIYAGDSVDGEFVGTLEQVVQQKYQLTTRTNKKMSVYTFGLSETIDYPLFLAQDWEDSVSIFYYQGANCPSTGDCNLSLTGIGQDTYMVTDYNGPEIIKDFKTFVPGCTVSVYENTVSNTTLAATLTPDNYKQQLPLQVNGVMKYYVLNGVGTSEMIITRDTSRASRH